jgi:putative adenylate-forming enzyme
VIDSLAILAQYLCVRHGRRFRTRADLERHQRRAFDRLARRHLARSAFYRPYVGRPLDAYPRIDKAIMLESFDRINTRGLSRDRLFEMALRAEATRDFSATSGDFAVGLSSGTSGRRSLFVTSRRERQLYIGGVLARALPGSIFEPHRIALLLRANNRLYAAAATGRIAFRFFDLVVPFEQLLDELQRYQPDVLIGPPQALGLVADAQRAGRVGLAPRTLLSVAEILEAHEAAALENAFGVRVDEVYQATEGFLGVTCARGTLHLNEDVVLFEREWIDLAARCFVPIVTDLVRSTQPVVRYRLDDVLVERAEPCPCGSVLTPIERIRGRSDDVLYLPGRDDHLVAVMPDFVRDAMALRHPVVSDYRVIQLSPTCIALQVSGQDLVAARALAVDALATVFARHAVRQPDIRDGGGIDLDLTVKLRRVERRFKLPVG